MYSNNESDAEFRSSSPLTDEGHLLLLSPNFNSIKEWRKMFDEGIYCDITIDVDGMLIGAHKLILMYRCQYFAAMFSGEGGDDVSIVYLDGFSFECVHFTLSHIYSGTCTRPYGLDIFELADIADLLCLVGLKELVIETLEDEYFHQFHRPCTECIAMISKFLRWRGVVGYTEVYYKMLSWIKQYGDVIWSKKEFAMLPYHDIKNCFLHQALDVNPENVLYTIKCCDKLMRSLPRVSWTVPIFRFSLELLRKCVNYISHHLADVLSSTDFLMIESNGAHMIKRLRDCMMAAIERADGSRLCRAYAHLHRLVNTQCNFASKWFDMLNRLTIHCEDSLVKCAHRAMYTSAWETLEPELQERIKRCSGIATVANNPKTIQPTYKYSNTRQIEKLKFILHTHLGSANRVPKKSQLPDKKEIAKSSVVAPGNSMVSSTHIPVNKSAQRSMPSAIPIRKSSTYKDVKSRYMNPKSSKSDQETSPANKSIDSNSNKNEAPIADKIIAAANTYDKQTNETAPYKNDNKQSLGAIRKHSISKLPTRKSYRDNMPERLTKSVPLIKEPNAFSYVSPYKYRSFVKATDPLDSTPSTRLNDKADSKKKSTGTSDGDLLKTPSRSMYENKTSLSMFNKSLTPKNRSSNDNSSSYSSPSAPSLMSKRFNSVRYSNKDILLRNYQKSTLARDDKTRPTIREVPIRESKIRYNPVSKSALNISTKFVKKSAFASGLKSNNISPELIDRSKSTPVVNSDEASSNDISADFVLERSRTFIKSEPSFISKDITSDSSIEMYPK